MSTSWWVKIIIIVEGGRRRTYGKDGSWRDCAKGQGAIRDEWREWQEGESVDDKWNNG